MKRLIFLALSVGLSGSTSLSLAQEAESTAPAQEQQAAPDGQKAPHHHHGPWRLLKQLDLSADQKTQVRDIFKENGPKMRELFAQIKAAKASGGDVQDLRAQMKAERATVQTAIKGVLTEEQAQKYDQLLAERAEKWQQRRDQQAAPAN